MAKAFAQGVWTFRQREDFVAANFSGTGKHKAEILSRLSSEGLNEEIADASVWVSDRVSDPAKTVWGLTQAKYNLSQAIDKSRFAKDKDYAKQMETELSRLDAAIKDEEAEADRGKDLSADNAWAEFMNLESLFVSGKVYDKIGRPIQFQDLYAKYLEISKRPGLGRVAKDMWDRMNKNELYRSTLKEYDTLFGRGAGSGMIQAIYTALSDQTLGKLQVGSGELFPSKGTMSIENQSRLDTMMADVIAETNSWVRSGDYKDEGEIRDHMLKLAIPYLKHWDMVGEIPMDRWLDKNPQLAEYGQMVNAGELNSLSGTDPLLGTRVAPKGWEKAAALYRSRAMDVIGELSKKGSMPSLSDLVPVTDPRFVNEGDLAFTPKSGKGMYFVDIIDGKPAITYKEDPTSPYAARVIK